jgi:hypothetical protein
MQPNVINTSNSGFSNSFMAVQFGNKMFPTNSGLIPHKPTEVNKFWEKHKIVSWEGKLYGCKYKYHLAGKR